MGQVSLADDGIWQHDDGAILVQCRVVKLSQLVIIVRESRHRVVLPDRQRGSPCSMDMHGTETSSPELSVAWSRLTAQGPMDPGGQEGRLMEVTTDIQTKEEQNQVSPTLTSHPPSLFSGAGLQLPTRVTTNKVAWLASCQIDRGAVPVTRVRTVQRLAPLSF